MRIEFWYNFIFVLDNLFKIRISHGQNFYVLEDRNWAEFYNHASDAHCSIHCIWNISTHSNVDLVICPASNSYCSPPYEYNWLGWAELPAMSKH